MQTKTRTKPPIAIQSSSFQEGYQGGLNGYFRGVRLTEPLTEETIVEIVQNLTEIAVEGWLTEELVRRDAGIIAGWIVRCAMSPAS